MRPVWRRARWLAAILCAAAGTRGDVLRGPYVLLEDAGTLRIRFEAARPEHTVTLLHGAGARTPVQPDYRRGARDTFLADVVVDLAMHRGFRGYEIGRAGAPSASFAWRSRIDGTPGRPPRLVVFGDSQGGPATLARLASRWREAEFDLLVGLGDLTDAGSRYESWAEEFFEPLRHVLPHVPVLPICGNHDSYRERSLQWFDWYFGRRDGRRFFRADFGDLRLVGLNNSDLHTKYGFDPIDPLTPQYDFLLESLLGDTVPDRRVVLFAHVPIFSASTVVNREFGSELQRRYVWPMLERSRAIGFFAGHHHKYERLLRRGWLGDTQHVVTGGAGGRLFTTARETGGAAMDRQILGVHHYLQVDFDGAGAIVARDVDGREIDRTTFGEAAPAAAAAEPLSLWRATLEPGLESRIGSPVDGPLTLRPVVASPSSPATAELYRTSTGFVGVACGLAKTADAADMVTWQGYDAGAGAWGYLQGAIMTAPIDGPRGDLAIVALNGAELSPLDRIYPVLHWPVAASRAGVREDSGAVLLLRGTASYDLHPDPSRVLGRWAWGDRSASGVARAQAARQLDVVAAATAPRRLAGDAPSALLASLRETPHEVFVVRKGGGAVVATLVHWAAARFLAIAPGTDLRAEHGALFVAVPSATGLELQARPAASGLWITAPDRPGLFIPLARGK